MKKQYEIHVIPNTHWDREWLYSFQETRLMLANFMETLLEIFRTRPAYKSYLLDSQVIPLEDFLEIHPERRAEIEEYVKSRRLLVGPWYTLPEEHLVNGESLVRNLLIGHRISKSFGNVMKIGYSPFSYGQAAQMPQIYQGFGIDTILYYHGITPDEAPAEFIFEGPDGSQLFGSRMGSFARYNFFYLVFRPMVYGKSTLEREYNWTEGGLPFHLCDESNHMEHHFLVNPKKYFHKEKLAELLQKFIEIESEHATTEFIAAMQGMDSTLPDALEVDIVAEAEKLLDGHKIIHSSLPEWMAKVREAAKDLVVLKGERRTPREIGTRVHLYGDVTSTRSRMKRQNARSEIKLQRLTEPVATAAWLVDAAYPFGALRLAWKKLLQCHPHDSIAGTGVDQIEKDVLNRLEQVQCISHGIMRNSLQNIQLRIDNSDLNDDQVLLTVWNPSPMPRSEIVTAFVDLPISTGLENFSLQEATTGKLVKYWEISREKFHPVIRHLGDATMQMPSIRVQLELELNNLPPLGYRTLILKPEKTRRRLPGSLVTCQHTMENEFLKVEINDNGTLDLTHKSSGQTFRQLHYFEDDGEAGHAWRHVKPAHDRIISSLGAPVTISNLKASPLEACFQVDYHLQIPTQLVENQINTISRLDADGDNARRSETMNPLKISSFFTLRKHSPMVEVQTVFENTSRDHRLRVLFPTHLNATHSAAESAFEVVERPVIRDENSPWRETWNPTHPQHRFVDVSDQKLGLAVINDGLREYEVTDDANRAIGLTLVRAFEIALTTVSWRWERHPEMNMSQVPGKCEFRYAIFPHIGNWDAGNVFDAAEKLTIPVQIAQAGPHPGTLPKELSFLQISPETVVLSAVKKAEDRDSLILRLYNPSVEAKSVKIELFKPIKHAWQTNLNEERQSVLNPAGKQISFDLAPKKIATIEVVV